MAHTDTHTGGEGRLQIQDQVNEMLVAAICASESSLLRDSFGQDHTVRMLQDSQDGCFQQPIQVKKLAGVVGSVLHATFTLDIGYQNCMCLMFLFVPKVLPEFSNAIVNIHVKTSQSFRVSFLCISCHNAELMLWLGLGNTDLNCSWPSGSLFICNSTTVPSTSQSGTLAVNITSWQQVLNCVTNAHNGVYEMHKYVSSKAVK